MTLIIEFFNCGCVPWFVFGPDCDYIIWYEFGHGMEDLVC